MSLEPVTLDNCAREPIHIPGSEAEIAQHIETVNKQRRAEQERMRKEAARRQREKKRRAA